MQISIDGNQHTHDFLRKEKNGSGTFKEIIANIKILDRINVRYHVLATLASISEMPSKILDEFDCNQINSPYFNILNPITQYNYEYLSPIKSEMVVADLVSGFDLIFKENIETALHRYPNIRFFLKRFFSLKPRASCGVGENRIAVKYNGEIYPCRRMVDNHDFCIGNAQNGIYFDKFEKICSSAILNNINCMSCEYNVFCGGTCLHEGINKEGCKLYTN